jgi:hypothetical protein
MPAQDNKALIRRFYEEIDNGNLEAMDDLVAEKYLDQPGQPQLSICPGTAVDDNAMTGSGASISPCPRQSRHPGPDLTRIRG